MFKKILAYGALAGAIVSLHLFGLTLIFKGHVPMPWGMIIGYTVMLIALSTVFVAIKRHRDIMQGGVIRFWPAFGLGLGISLVAAILYVLGWEAALAVTGLDFGQTYGDAYLAEQKAAGVSGEALAKLTAEMAKFAEDYRNPLYRMPMTFSEIFPVGILVSLVSAGLLRNSRFLAARR
ncbi:DUF4199 domain-containing protein [Asticcacaulis sp. YBE204]|uniref:DUF4199 domain-containing protein n=1 Tax=Asticcacaulis sp. YBE204 TaxID=1282363 RepID=UPI0003C3DD25|nr:DUF4199 domain-containing protein [Asticcacaulis sp. YBE204]ESQ77338.1 hypothetical protein AEYBE204_17580 [Asticcacaulis sp. YBE204]